MVSTPEGSRRCPSSSASRASSFSTVSIPPVAPLVGESARAADPPRAGNPAQAGDLARAEEAGRADLTRVEDLARANLARTEENLARVGERVDVVQELVSESEELLTLPDPPKSTDFRRPADRVVLEGQEANELAAREGCAGRFRPTAPNDTASSPEPSLALGLPRGDRAAKTADSAALGVRCTFLRRGTSGRNEERRIRKRRHGRRHYEQMATGQR